MNDVPLLPPSRAEIDAYVQSVFDRVHRQIRPKPEPIEEPEPPIEEYDDGRDFTPPYEP